MEKFVRTLKEIDPGEGYFLKAMCAWHDTPDEVRNLFYGLNVGFFRYDGPGLDTGSAQFSSDQMTRNNFMVCFTTRHYFWKAGWLMGA